MLKTFRKYRLFTTMLPIILVMALLPWGEAQSFQVNKEKAGPVNPSAAKEARELLEYMTELGGKGLISGQHDYLESPDEFNNKLKQASGEHAVLHGYELGALNNQSRATIARQRDAVIDSAIKWHRAGGIVAITFHQNLPGTSPEWSNVSMELSQEKFNAYVTPGNPEYKSLIAELDEIAGYLKELRDAGVPVLWRPYHEMNGGWFWWGKKSNFNTLWDIMYDRFVNKHHLNNLLWVWSPNAPNEWSDPYGLYYPGADKVDILAADIYNNDFEQSYYDELLELAGTKPIGIGESGELPDPSILSSSQSKWVFMMTWGKMLIQNNSSQNIKRFMSNSYTVSREDYIRSVGSESATDPKNSAGNKKAGLKAEYYDNMELSGEPVLSRRDDTVDFNWHESAPGAGIGQDSFSVRWSGQLKPETAGVYKFTAEADDGVRVWIGGKLIINTWKNGSGKRKGEMTLAAGKFYPIKVEYYENRGNANIRLMWEGPQQEQSVLSPDVLYSN